MIKNFLWDFIGRFGNVIITFFISIVLARLLNPDEYGIMGMAMVIIGVAAVFVDLGFYKAIAQRKDITDLQLSTIFYVNLGFAFLLTLFCFAIAQTLSRFYNQPIIEPLFKVLSATFIINALYLVPSAIAYKEMKFRTTSLINLLAIIISGGLGIIAAYSGYGVWSLAVQTLSHSFILCVLHFSFYRWKPILAFSPSSIKPLWQYGSRILATSFMELTFARADMFIIGKLFPVSILGYYSRAQALEGIIRQFSINSFMNVLFPIIAKHQDNRYYLTSLYKSYLQIICFIAFGLSGLLFVSSIYLFVVLFSQKWLYAGTLFQIMAAFLYTYPLNSLMSNIITGVGNTKSYLRLELIKKVTLLPVYFFGFFWGLEWFILILAIANFINMGLTCLFVTNEVHFSFWEHYNVISKYFLICIMACVITYLLLLPLSISSVYLNLFLYSFLFGISYIGLSNLFKLDGKRLIWEGIYSRLLLVLNRSAQSS